MESRLGPATLLLVLPVFLACSASDGEDAFAAEYAELNGAVNTQGQAILDVELPPDHRFHIASEEEIYDLLGDGDGVIYFGFPECPWCRNTVQAINEAARQSGVDQVHYVNVSEIREPTSVAGTDEDPGGEGPTDFYVFALDELGEFAPEYPTADDPNGRRILVPLVAVVVDGDVIASHLGTVESQADPYVPLTEEQHDELVNIYATDFSLIPS